MPGSCNSGFEVRAPGPPAAAGFETDSLVNSSRARKPSETMPSTPSTRATTSCGSRREKTRPTAVHSASISSHSSSEPSCAPHTAEAVEQRQQRIAVLRDVLNERSWATPVVRARTPDPTSAAARDRRPRHRHPDADAALCAPTSAGPPAAAPPAAPHQREVPEVRPEMAELAQHQCPVGGGRSRTACFVVRGRHLVATSFGM